MALDLVMENTIRITQLYDFLFCPYSIYLHNIYESLNEWQYHDAPQIKGKQAHKSVDDGSYSTRASEVSGMAVYSERYGLAGNIDQYFIGNECGHNKLVERKRTIKNIYDGFKLQLYAQYYCMLEMGFKVDSLYFHSLTDNRSYELEIPDSNIQLWFEGHLKAVRDYDPSVTLAGVNINKCRHCIYRELCDQTDLSF